MSISTLISAQQYRAQGESWAHPFNYLRPARPFDYVDF